MDKKRLLKVANLLLMVAIVATVLLAIRGVVSASTPEKSFKLAQGQPTAAGPAPAQNLMAYAQVTRDNVFGFPPVELKPIGTGRPGAAAPSSLDLIGTVSGALDYAVFLMGPKQEIYKANQMIPGVGYLKKIARNHVEIAGLEGGNISVQLKDLAAIKDMGNRPQIPGNPGTAGAPQAGPQDGIKQTGSDSYIVDKGAMAAELNNPSRILGDARMLPNMVNGKQQGFVLNEVKPGGVFSNLGLRNGDVLLRVNNNDISGPGAALQAFTSLRGMDRVDLDVMRGGQKLTLSYQIR